jgi:hypothetical protein
MSEAGRRGALSRPGIFDLAFDEARALGDTTVGTWHFLLGIARGDSLAARALRECGATPDRLTDAYKRRRAQWEEEHPQAQRDWLQPNPAAYALMGRAEAFAAAAGSTRVAPEHALLGLLWDFQSVQTALLRAAGTSRAEVRDALGRLGGYIPPIDLPPEDWRPWGERVWVPADRFGLVLRNVMARLPEGTRFGFNRTADGRYWMQAGAEFDLQAIVDEVLA